MNYEIKNFNEVNGDATILFDEKYLVLVNIPVVEGNFLTGVDLDAHIARYAPIQKKQQEEQARIASNKQDILNMVVPLDKVVEPTIEQSIDTAMSEIMNIRENKIASGITYKGVVYNTDMMARILITQAIVTLQATGYTGTIEWDDIDGATQSLTLEDLVNISAFVMNSMISEYSDARAVAAQIKIASTKEEVDGIVVAHKQAKGIIE